MTDEKEKKETKPKQEVELVEVPTGSALAFKLPDGTIVNSEQYLVWIGNLVHKISKAL